MSGRRGAGYGAVLGALGAAALIGLPVAFGSAESRQVEWVWNLLFVGAPLAVLGAVAGAVVAGRPRAGGYGLAAIGVLAVVLVVLAGTTDVLG